MENINRPRPYAQALERLRRVGLRPTRQRLALAKLLFEQGDRHVTAERLHEEAGAAKVRVSLATVYNSLHQFTQLGLLREVVVEAGRSYFDTNTSDHHHFFFAQKADVEGFNDVSAVFRSTAEGETGHAHGHLEFLESVGDPATGLPIGPTAHNLKAAIAGETHEYTDMYPGMARTARDEGFE